MAVVGQAAVTAFDAPVVVTVDYGRATRAALGLAGAVMPVCALLAFLSADESAPLGGDPRVPMVLWMLALLPLTAGVVAIVTGTVRARLYLDNRVVDSMRWSFRPGRRLAATVGDHRLEAEISLGPEREVSFFVDGTALRTHAVG